MCRTSIFSLFVLISLRVLLYEGYEQLDVEEQRTGDARRELEMEMERAEKQGAKRELDSVKRELSEFRAGAVKLLMEGTISIADAVYELVL